MVGRDSDDYYESYAPTRRHQQTLRIACPPGGARRHRAGSHVHYRSLGGVGAQLFPCGLVVTITRPLATRPRTTQPSRRREPGSRPFLRVPAHRLPGPYPSGLSRGLRFRGFNHWFTRITHCPPCLPRPRDPTVPARRVVVRAACRPSPQLRGQTALSFTGLPRQPGVGVSHPERTGSASWRTNGSQQTWACGSPSGALIAFSYTADMSIETALIDFVCSAVSPSKNACKPPALRPSVAHTIEPFSWSATQVRNV